MTTILRALQTHLISAKTSGPELEPAVEPESVAPSLRTEDGLDAKVVSSGKPQLTSPLDPAAPKTRKRPDASYTSAEATAMWEAVSGYAENEWSALRSITTPQLFDRVMAAQRRILGPEGDFRGATVQFFDRVLAAREAQPSDIAKLQSRPSKNGPIYYTYPQGTGAASREEGATFDAWAKNLEHIGATTGRRELFRGRFWKNAFKPDFGRRLWQTLRGQNPMRGMSFGQLYFLPHLESPMKDGGYDPKSLRVRASLGGEEAFTRFLGTATRRTWLDKLLGRKKDPIRVAHDVIGGHLSDESELFQRALDGDEEALSCFNVLPDEFRVTGFIQNDGQPYVRYDLGDGLPTTSWLIFSHASKTNVRVEFVPVSADAASKVPASQILHADGEADLDAIRKARVSPEPPWDIQKRYVEKDGQLFKITPFHHNFYDFQPGLNHASLTTQRMFFDFMADALNRGVSGLRADAAPHWALESGTNLQDVDADFALQELYNLYARHVAPNAFIVPEVSQPIADAKRYYGETIDGPDGKPISSMAGALLNFDGHAALYETALTGDSSAFLKHLDELDQLGILDRKLGLWNFMGHHDEMRIDKFTPEGRAKVEQALMDKGLLPFGGGRGISGRMGEMFDNDPERIRTAFDVLYELPGTPIVNAGNEIGARNDPEFMRTEQAKRMQSALKQGRAITPDEALDTRDLGRGFSTTAEMDEARAGRYPVVERLRARNVLWNKRASVRTMDVKPVAQDDKEVLSLARRSDGEDVPLLSLVNLSTEAKTVRVAKAELADKLDWGKLDKPLDKPLNDILAKQETGKKSRVAFRDEGDHVSFELAPNETRILEAAKTPREALRARVQGLRRTSRRIMGKAKHAISAKRAGTQAA